MLFRSQYYKGNLKYNVDLDDLRCGGEYIFAKNKLLKIIHKFIPVLLERTKKNQTGVWVKTFKYIQQKYGDPTIRNMKNCTYGL